MLTHSGLTLWPLMGREGERKGRGRQGMESETKVRREWKQEGRGESSCGENIRTAASGSQQIFPESPRRPRLSSKETAVKAAITILALRGLTSWLRGPPIDRQTKK